MFSIASFIAHLTNRGRLVPAGQLGQHGRLKTTLRNSGQLLEMVKSVIPPLEYSSHKGDSGRIGIIGGCQEYTGAPYFAAITALKVGADLSHVFCTKDSATVIKSYSPELIVHPILDTSYDAAAEISEWLPRLHAVVVGPGLGRSEKVIHNVKQVIEQIKERKLPIVIDADGLYLVTQYPEVIKNYERAILTPNVVEFSRLYEKVIGEKPISEEPVVSVRSLCEKMGHVTIVCKGENDIISDGTQVLVCCGEGSARRCGGQGDLLSGSMGTFSFWAHSITDSSSLAKNDSLAVYGPTICAAYAACLLTRECNRRAYAKNRRSMTTSDMVGCIQESFECLFD